MLVRLRRVCGWEHNGGGGVMVYVTVMVKRRCMNVARIVLVLALWQWVYSSRSDDSAWCVYVIRVVVEEWLCIW